ncbi:DEAD/DEAH box helicase [Streptomyces sp. SJL17-1]|uniref:DEAD/DEAH box helicase n=1 Tax=Streptomyces sp. SJL17-1 TaxID=2967223 RepID=UPI00296694AA|nr:DEAD/DEAH box helicase [Streptomyces sp. SJL17-1]
MVGRSQPAEDVRQPAPAEAGVLPAWHERAKRAVVEGRSDPLIVAEAERLARSRQLTRRDLRMLLLVTDDDPAWLTARRLAVEGLRDTPEVPQQILTAHAQLEFWPPLTYDESAEHLPDGYVLHTAAVRLGPADAQVTGPARSARTAALARRSAAEAMLRRLAGVGETTGEGSDERLTLPGMGTEAFESLVHTRATTADEPGEELAAEVDRRAGSARLRHRDIHLLLFAARGPGWRESRVRALRLAARMQNSAATLLRWHADEEGAELRHTVVASDGGFSCHWSRDARDGRTIDGAERTARDRRQAVHLGAVALLAELTGLPEPEEERASDGGGTSRSVRIQPVPAGQDPVKYLNKYTQLEVISKPESTFTAAPKSAACTYTCTLVRTGAEVSVTRRAKTRADARRAAASALMEELVAHDATPTPPARGAERPSVPGPRNAEGRPPVPGRTGDPGRSGDPVSGAAPEPGSAPAQASAPAPAPAPAPALRIAVGAVITEALAAGCAVAFLPAAGAPAALLLHRADGAPMPDVALPAPLSAARRSLVVPPSTVPVPVTGWRVPLAQAVPVLLRRDREAGWHPTAVEWEQATRLGLRAVAAGLVRPALTPDGTDRWRVGPLPGALARAVEELARRMSPQAHAAAHADSPAATATADADADATADADADADADGGRFPAARDALPAFLDALADTMLRPPAAVLFGTGPFLAPAGRPLPEPEAGLVRPWLDAVEDRLYAGPPPGLVVEFAEPSEEEAAAGRLTGRLLVAVDPDEPDKEVPAARLRTAREPVAGVEPYHLWERVRLRIERAARRCGLLAALLTSPERLVADATGIARLLDAEADLAAEGLVLRRPPGLRDPLSAHTVVGSEIVVTAGDALCPHPTGGAPRFSLQALLDFRWQFALGGDVLSEAEMDALAEAARPLVRVRDRWVLLDPLTVARVRRREIGPLAGIDALTAALTGTVSVDGRTVPCRAGGSLAAVVDILRRGEHAPPVPAPAGLAATLRAYQERALAWLAHTGGIGFGAVLADDMGLGKTLTAIAYTLHRYENGHRGPVLVVCPSSLVTNWEREFRRFAPQLDVTVHHGVRRNLDVAGERTVVLTTYGVLRRDDELTTRSWDMVIADEAQHAKNHASSTARRLHALTSTTRLALSGTPVENNLSELWTLLDWANPGLFGPLKSFRSRYAAAAERDPDGPAAHALARLIAPFLLRRRKTDPHVAPELPAKVETRRIVELTAEQVALYEAVVRETMEQLAHSPSLARSGLVFKLITALKQITNHPAHYWGEDHPGPSGAGEFTARSAKLEALGELVEAITARGEAALVFTSYVTMGRLLTEHLTHLGHRPLFLHGGQNTRQRQELVDAFQAGRSPLFVLSLKAGGTGLTLTRASHVVHFDRSWNAAVEDQASDRAHRIGQRRTVTVHRLVTRGTIEDRIDQLLAHKRALQETVLGTGDAGIARLSDRELVDLVSLGDPS